MRGRLLSAAAAAAFSLCSVVASATTIVVDSSIDDGAHCTLRNAVATSSDNLPHGTCAVGGASNTIQFAANDFNNVPLTTITIGSPAINIINNSLVIQGNGPANTIIDAANNDRVFDNCVSPATSCTGPAINITWQDLT